MLKNSLRIIYLVKKRNSLHIKKTHKFVIEVPKFVAQAYNLYEKKGNTLCEDDISKEMKYVSPSFRELDCVDIVTIGY